MSGTGQTGLDKLPGAAGQADGSGEGFSVPQALQQAVAFHKAGKLKDALGLYDKILAVEPDHPDAVNFCGVAAFQSGDVDQALALLRRGVALKPDFAEAHVNYANVLRASGDLEGAASAYERAAEIKPDFVMAHVNLAMALEALDKPEAAVAAYQHALEIKPDLAEVHLSLGIAQNKLGDLDAATATFRRAAEIRPDFAEAHYNLGTALKAAGEMEAAVAAYRRAVEIRPDYAEAHNNLGAVLQEEGELEAAAAAYRRAVEIRPDFAEAHYNLGIALKTAGEVKEAAAAYRHAVEIRPDYAEAHNNLGAVLQEEGEMEAAAAAHRRAVEIRPDFAEAHNNLGMALREGGTFDGAAAAHRRALEIRPDFAEAHNNLGVALLQLEDLEAATAAFRRALEIKPDLANAHNNLGFALSQAGELDAARTAHRRALEIEPDLAVAYEALAELKAFTPGDGDVAAMESLLASPSLADKQAMRLCFALGKAYEALGDYDRAFASFARANRLKRSSIDYDITKDESRVDRITAAFDRELLARAAGHGCASELPVFIVGMPRSATTLVEQILASHSQVHGAGEIKDIGEILDEMRLRSDVSRNFTKAAAALGAEDLRCLGQEYVDAVRRRAPDVLRVTDKMPGNFLYVGFIHMILPNARVINCVRHPADTCFSCYRTHFMEAQSFTYDLAELGRYYRLYDRLMRHWRAVVPGRILDVRYEDLIADQEGETRRLLEFCDLPWENACLSFHLTARPVRTASVAQVRRPIFKDALQRWRRYEPHLGPLLEELGPLAAEY